MKEPVSWLPAVGGGDVMDKYDNKTNQSQALAAASAAILLALAFEREEPQDKIDRIAKDAISCLAKCIKEDV